MAEWCEIDLKSETWTIPAPRMKARREHRVPLADRVMEILSEAQALYGEDNNLVFPSSSGKPLSIMVCVVLLRRPGIPAVPHGFRSSFRDWCIEQTGVPRELGEAALAHKLGNSTQTAYARTDFFEKRRGLMEGWEEFLVSGRHGSVSNRA